MKKIAVLTLSAMLVGGCALPLPLTVASLVADGVSYATTQKSLTDHGISAIAQRDCAMHRMFTDGDLCDNDSSETVVALTEIEESEPALVPVAAKTISTTPYQSAPDLGAIGSPISGVYIVISSSLDASIARRVALNFMDVSARVFAQAPEGRAPIFRVVAGPVTRPEFVEAKSYLAKRGVSQPWALKIEEEDWRQWPVGPQRRPAAGA